MLLAPPTRTIRVITFEYDPFDNISLQGLDEITAATAYTVNVLAINDLPAPAPSSSSRAVAVDANEADLVMDYDGPRLIL